MPSCLPAAAERTLGAELRLLHLKLDLEFLEFVGFRFGGPEPLEHGRPLENPLAVRGALGVELDVVG